MIKRKVYYLDQNRERKNTAGAKAPDDIAELCKRRGFIRFTLDSFPGKKNLFYKKIWLATVGVRQWQELFHIIDNGDIVIFQHPFYGKRIALKWIKKIQKKKDCKFIAIIHDLESLRGGIAGVVKTNRKTNQIGDNDLLKCFDKIICHNKYMKQYMIQQGFESERLISLEIFDYLSESFRIQHEKNNVPSIAIAGNLAIGKSKYIYDICKSGHNKHLIINLYGNNFEQKNAVENMKWHGSFKPEELPEHLEGDFGLVWDGISVETCAGNTGEYLKYNNPHKTSLYLSSGIPVIVWDKAAIADFVLENKVGITVNNLFEVEERIQAISIEDYKVMCMNVQAVSKKLHEGYYFYKALDASLN